MRVCTAPEILGFPLTEKKSIFLAGSIEQGRADLWQDYVISQLDHLRVAVFNPRRAVWNASLEQSIHNAEFNAQVNWELDRIESADIVWPSALVLATPRQSRLLKNWLVSCGVKVAGGGVP